MNHLEYASLRFVVVIGQEFCKSIFIKKKDIQVCNNTLSLEDSLDPPLNKLLLRTQHASFYCRYFSCDVLHKQQQCF